jgi:sugar lactone lactonase YvrE
MCYFLGISIGVAFMLIHCGEPVGVSSPALQDAARGACLAAPVSVKGVTPFSLATASLPDNVHVVNYLALSCDNELLAWCEYNEVRVWSFRKRRQVAVISHKNQILGLAISPDGRTLAISVRGGGIELWSTATWTRRAILGDVERREDIATAIAVGKEGRLLAAGFYEKDINSASEVRICDMATRQVRVLGEHANSPMYLCLSADGRYVASGSWTDGVVVIWDVKKRKKYWSLRPHTDPRTKRGAPHGLGFLADSRSLLTAGSDGMIRIWDIKNKKENKHFDGKVGEIEMLAVSPDGKRVAVAQSPCRGGACPSDLRIWDVATGKQLGETRRLANGVACMCFSTDGKYLLMATCDEDFRKGRLELVPVKK